MPHTSKTDDEKNYGAYLLIGAVFLAFGIALSVNGLSMLMLYYQSGDWQEVPVQIMALELQVHRGEKKTYSVRCTYEYEWNGKTYTGTRVGIEDYNSQDRFHARRYNTLKHCQQEGRRFRAWVNPGSPAESLLFREYQDTMAVHAMAGILFFVIGACLTGWGLRTRKMVQKTERDYPETPWRAESAFQDFIIKDNSLKDIGKAFAAAILMGLFWSIFLFGFRIYEKGPFFARIIIGIFLLITLGIFFYAVCRSLHYLKYGSPVLILSHLPIVETRPFCGFIHMARPVIPQKGLHLTFVCMKEYVQEKKSYSKNRHYVKEAVYSDSLTLYDGEHSPVGQVWMFTFNVPDGCPDRNITGSTKYRWLLKAEAEMPGIDFSACFDLPVYRVSDEADIRENSFFSQ